MTTYSPRDAQQRERKSGFQLDALRSPFKEHNNEHITGVEEASGLGGRIGEFKGKIHNDANGKTTSSMMSPTFIPAPQQNPGHEPAEEYKGPRIWRDFVRDWPISSQQLAIFVLFLLLWIMAYAHAPKYAAPETTIMRIAFLFLGAEACGILVTHIHLPDMLGMLIFGVLYENMGWADFTGYGELEAFLRELALINIMLLAGFGLDGHAFKKCWGIILRLVLIPSIAEVGVICALSHYLLGMPWFWGLLLGLLITAVSPNVIVTVMLHLKEEKLGLNKGIHTIIYGMTSSNDIVSIFTFGCILGVIFNQGKFSDAILQGPVGIVVGIVYGYIFGLMLVYLPSRHSKYVNALRFAMTVLGGCVSVMGSRAMGYPSAGALGCVTLAFVAGQLWKKQQRKTHIFPNTSERLDLLWTFLKPVSFALIGKEINLSVLDGRIVGYGLVVIITGCLFRLVTAYFSTARAQLDLKERLYITISSFPKATVQAALGPIALDLARELNSGPEILSLASNILVISVIAIICTAPLGAILMMRLAPVWLKRGEVPEEEEEGVVRIPEHHTEDDDIVMVTLDDNRAVTDSGQTNIAFEHGDR